MGSAAGKKKGEVYKSTTVEEEQKFTSETSDGLRRDNSEKRSEIADFLAKVPLFKRLVRKQLTLIAAACEPCEFKEGAEVITQGDVGDSFFLIQSGSASVHVAIGESGERKVVANLKDGDYFGEKALLHDVPRTATVVANSNLSTLRLDREHFHALGLESELPITRRKAVGGGAKIAKKAATRKSPEDQELIARALRGNDRLQNFAHLGDAAIQAMIDVSWEQSVPAGQALIKEGDPDADYFYIVKDGSFDVLQVGLSDKSDIHASGKKDDTRSAERAATRAKSLRAIGAGGSFGELALLCHAPRSATVQAISDSIVWVFDRESFKKIMMSASAAKVMEYEKYLEKVEILKPLWPSERKLIAEALIEVHFAAGDAIMTKGEAGNSMYILIDGEVAIVDDGAELKRLCSDPSHQTAPIFGERSILKDEPRSSTVVAKSDVAKTLVLDRTSFNLLLGPLQEVIAHHETHGDEKESYKPGTLTEKEEVVAGPESKGIKMKDLTKVGLLGCGSFGYVEMYEHKDTGTCYAVKAQGKGYIQKVGATFSIVQEKNILKMMDCPWIIRLYETYNTPEFIFFLMELALGGDLQTVYHRNDLWGSEKHARFYVAGIICAFVHLHAKKVMYRDLKPENIMLTDTGHVKLTDMGLAKVVAGKTYTCCGTPDYFAPELLESQGYTHAVDWWTLGVLTFELMSGYSPFEAGSDAELYRKIAKGIERVRFPKKWRNVVSDFVKQLMAKMPQNRLPMKVGGTKLLRAHNWYSGFDWASYADQTFPAPFVPAVAGAKDLSNFCVDEEEKPEMVPFVDDGTGWDNEF